MSPSQTSFSPRRAVCALDGLHGSVGAARDFTRAFLADAAEALPASVLEDVLLVVSELVTNAVRHAPGPCALDLTQDRDQVTIAVSDSFAALPVPRRADLTSGTGGLGWHLLGDLARYVRVAARPDGKTITAVLPRLLLAGV